MPSLYFEFRVISTYTLIWLQTCVNPKSKPWFYFKNKLSPCPYWRSSAQRTCQSCIFAPRKSKKNHRNALKAWQQVPLKMLPVLSELTEVSIFKKINKTKKNKSAFQFALKRLLTLWCFRCSHLASLSSQEQHRREIGCPSAASNQQFTADLPPDWPQSVGVNTIRGKVPLLCRVSAAGVWQEMEEDGNSLRREEEDEEERRGSCRFSQFQLRNKSQNQLALTADRL